MSFNYHHAFLKVEFPAPGHYALWGMPKESVYVEGEGTVVAPGVCYISPAVPDDWLEAVLRDRADRRSRGVESAPVTAQPAPATIKRGRGRPRKTPVLEAQPGLPEANRPAQTTSIAPMNSVTEKHELRDAEPAAVMPPVNLR